MQLSKEKPTRTGHYWYQPPGKSHEMVEVKQFGDGSLTVYAAAWWGDTVDQCDGLFSARIPEPRESQGQTVRVRVAVVTTSLGEWNARGWHDGNDAQFTDYIGEHLTLAPAEAVHFIEADVPLPVSPTTIPAEVQHAG